MADRTINFGVDETEATYQIQDDDPFGGGNFKINDTDAATAIFEYDQANSQWALDEIQITTADVTTVNVATAILTSADVDTLNGANVNTASSGQLLQSDGNGQLQFITPDSGVPTGGIIMWSGSIPNIPSGFALCDGTNGTPDLTDRFVVGAGGSDYSVDDTGGLDEVQLTIDEMPSHSHDYVATSFNEFSDRDVPELRFENTTEIASTENTGNDEAHENRPPYYALAYIMKT